MTLTSRRPAKPRPPKITETQVHKQIAAYFRKVGLGGNAIALHIRNERAGDWQRIQAWRMGVMSGVCDWLIIDGGRALFAEIKPIGWGAKKQRTGRFTEHETRQLDTHNLLRRAGASVVIVETLDELLQELAERGVPLRQSDIVTEGLREHLPNAMAQAALAEMCAGLADDDLDRAIDGTTNHD